MPGYPLGPEKDLGGVLQGARADIPPNSVLTGLQLGKGDYGDDDHWLRVWYRTLDFGEENMDLEEPELALPPITAPDAWGGSGTVHVPDNCILTAIQFGGETLSIWYKRIISPKDIAFGPEQQSLWTKEARSGGGGQLAEALGCTLTGFQLHKDPDKQMSIQIWYKTIG
jgi:hypothetical protein